MVCVCYSPNKNVQFCPVFPIFFSRSTAGRKSLGDGSCNWLRVRRSSGANGSTPLRHFPRELRSDLASNQ